MMISFVGGGEYLSTRQSKSPIADSFPRYSREPHVGVEVCMRAFRKVPEEMRERLALKTNGTRLLGGSPDTLYIPGKHRDTFLEILGLFLETDCFLEIATPTAVHLVVPPDEPILYVDHVCPSFPRFFSFSSIWWEAYDQEADW